MKHFLTMLMVLLTLNFCTAALADTPANVLNDAELATLTTKYAEYTTVSAYRCDATNTMVSLHKAQGENLLVWLRNGSIAYDGANAIPQGFPVYLGKDTSCTDPNHLLHFTAVQAISETDESTSNDSTACHYYLDSNGDMRLAVYRVGGTVIQVDSDGLTFDGVTVSGVIENRMVSLNLAKFPKTLAAAKRQMSNVPEIPQGTLTAACITFAANERYPVYSAPDADSIRGANNKALVSTNDWVQVFGREGQWLMVQYDITAEHFRIGYITVDALPANTTVQELNFSGTAAVTTQEVKVTDDPLNSQSTLLSLPKDANVLTLGTMGAWSYIEGVSDGRSYRGFVPTESLSTSNVVSSLDEARNILAGTWTVYAGGADQADSLSFASDGTLHGHFSTNPRNGLNTLQLIAGSEKLTDWDGQWTLESYDAARQLYWNDPEFELTITRNGEQQRYGLQICWEPYASSGADYALILSDSEQSSGLVLCK